MVSGKDPPSSSPSGDNIRCLPQLEIVELPGIATPETEASCSVENYIKHSLLSRLEHVVFLLACRSTR